jgi:protein involved in polysaccharide export with SLBB domain
MLLTGCCCAPGNQNVLLHSTEELLQKTPPALARELSKQLLPPYLVEPGDVLLVQPAEIGEQRVLADGTISLSRFGTLLVANKTLPEVEVLVRATIAKEVKEPGPISVRLAESHSKFFYVLGEVNAQGAYPLTGRETVLDGIAAACGLTCRAAKCRIILSRPTAPDCCRIVVPICYDEIVQHGDTTTNYQLMPGDRIFVPSQSLCEACCGWFKKEGNVCGCHSSEPCSLSANCESVSAAAARGPYNFGALTTPLRRYFTWVQTDAPVTDTAPVAASTPAVPTVPAQVPMVAPVSVLQMSKDVSLAPTVPMEAPRPLTAERPTPVTIENPWPVSMEMTKPIKMEMPRPAAENPKPIKIEYGTPATVEAPKPVAAPPTAADLFRQIIFAGRAAENVGEDASPKEATRAVEPAAKPVSEKPPQAPAKPKEGEASKAPPKQAADSHAASSHDKSPEAKETQAVSAHDKSPEPKETQAVSAEQAPPPAASKPAKVIEECGPPLPDKDEVKPAAPAEPAAMPPLHDEAEPIEPSANADAPVLPESHSLDAFLSLFFGKEPPSGVQPVSKVGPHEEDEHDAAQE